MLSIGDDVLLVAVRSLQEVNQAEQHPGLLVEPPDRLFVLAGKVLNELDPAVSLTIEDLQAQESQGEVLLIKPSQESGEGLFGAAVLGLVDQSQTRLECRRQDGSSGLVLVGKIAGDGDHLPRLVSAEIVVESPAGRPWAPDERVDVVHPEFDDSPASRARTAYSRKNSCSRPSRITWTKLWYRSRATMRQELFSRLTKTAGS